MGGWAWMSAWSTGLAVATATLSLLVLLWQRPKRDADVLFAVVSASMALSLMRPWVVAAPAWMHWAMAIGGCMTCNGFWLVSRALFRGDGGVGRAHLAVAAGMAVLMVAYRVVSLDPIHAPSPWATGLGGLLTLGSSALLVASFLEALRGWSPQWPRPERRLRVAFLLAFGATVLVTTLLGALVDQGAVAGEVRSAVIGLCATVMIGVTHALLRHRHRYPVTKPLASRLEPRPAAPITAADERLAQALRHQLEVRQVFREPELKIADLAARLGTAEHKLSRVITQVLVEKNFNQLLNRHRIDLACQLLADRDCVHSILDISSDCGFASLGPFNRAFKAATGCTPTAYRAARQAGHITAGASIESSTATGAMPAN